MRCANMCLLVSLPSNWSLAPPLRLFSGARCLGNGPATRPLLRLLRDVNHLHGHLPRLPYPSATLAITCQQPLALVVVCARLLCRSERDHQLARGRDAGDVVRRRALIYFLGKACTLETNARPCNTGTSSFAAPSSSSRLHMGLNMGREGGSPPTAHSTKVK
jgi:hypothetical protein